MDNTHPSTTAVAFGPSLTFVLNGKIVTGALVDARFAEGVAGAWLQPADDTGAELALDWVQVRAVLWPIAIVTERFLALIHE